MFLSEHPAMGVPKPRRRVISEAVAHHGFLTHCGDRRKLNRRESAVKRFFTVTGDGNRRAVKAGKYPTKTY
jgi:hypothetical protein